jgi:iron(III) transport system permease protein
MVGGAMRRSELGAPSRSGRERDWGRRFFAEVISNRRLFVGALGVVLALLTLGPLATVLVSSFRPDGLPLSPGWTFDNYISVWSDSYSWMLLANSLIFSLGSTVFALLISIMLAWLIERTDVPAAGFLRAAILMPMATPPLLLAIGWALVLSPQIGILPSAIRSVFGAFPAWADIYSLPGAVFVQGLAYVPTCFLMLSPALRAIDPSFEEAALMAHATRWRIFHRIVIPFLTPTLISAATILTMVGILAFDVPAVIAIPGNVPLLSIEVFRVMTPTSGLPDYGAGGALSSAVLLIMIIGLMVYARATGRAGRFATISGKAYRPHRTGLGPWRMVAVAFITLYILSAIILPLLALVWTSLMPYLGGFDWSLLHRATLGAYRDVLESPRVWSAAANALIIAGSVSLVLVALSLGVAWCVLRSGVRAAFTLDVLAMIPTGVPPLMMSMALIFLAFSFRFVSLYGTIWLIAIGHIIIFLPVACRMMQAGLLQINAELEEAATVSGAAMARTVRRIIAPLLRPTIIAMVIWVAVHSIREFSIAVMLQSNNNTVLSTILYNFWTTGSPAQAAAIAALLMLSLCALVACSAWIGRKREI